MTGGCHGANHCRNRSCATVASCRYGDRKWGEVGPIKAIDALEEDPYSTKAQAAVVEEKIVAARAAEDTEVLQALRQLVEQMKARGIGGEPVAKIQFAMSGGVVQGVAGAENVQIGSMTFGTPPKG